MSSASSIDLASSRTITGHARLAGNTSGNEDDLGTLEGSLDAAVDLGSVASDLSHCQLPTFICPLILYAEAKRTVLLVLTWPTSAATPGAPRMSKRESSVTRGLSLRRRDRGCPIPPPAPRTATLESCMEVCCQRDALAMDSMVIDRLVVGN